MNNFLKEIEERALDVSKMDLEILNNIKGNYKSFIMNIVILSSSIIIGVFPLLDNNSSIIKHISEAKFGLLIIVIIIIFSLIYYENVLTREKLLNIDLIDNHQKTFSNQFRIINLAIRDNKSDEEIEAIFTKSKGESVNEENRIRIKHITQWKFYRLMLFFIDIYYSRIICYGFTFGIVLIILSCI